MGVPDSVAQTQLPLQCKAQPHGWSHEGLTWSGPSLTYAPPSMQDPCRNHKTYREVLTKMKPPIIPFVPLILKGEHCTATSAPPLMSSFSQVAVVPTAEGPGD